MNLRLREAYADYWAAKTRGEELAAYRGILLFGGRDGYGLPGWRATVARWLRKLALYVENYE